MKYTWKQILSIIMGAFATFWQLYGVIFGLVCVAIVFDTITGVIAAKVAGKRISSKKAHQGFWKKVGLVVALFFGIFLDVFIPTALLIVHVDLPANTPFGLIFGCFIVFNEGISICENFDKINSDILPKWVKSLIQSGVENIDYEVSLNSKEDDSNERKTDKTKGH